MNKFSDFASDPGSTIQKGSVWGWVGAFSGLAFVGLLVASIIIGDADTSVRNSDPANSGAVIAQLYAERREAVQQGAALEVISIFFLLAFVSYLYQTMRASSDDWIPMVALGGGLVAAGYLLSVVNLELGTAAIDDYGQDTAAARALAAVTWESMLVLGAPLAAMVSGVSISALRNAFLPRWMGLAGLPVALMLLALPVAFVGFMLFVPWVILVSLCLLWQRWSSRVTTINVSGPLPQLS